MINATELRIGNKFIGIAGKQTVLSIIDNTDNGKIEYKSEHHKLMYSHLIFCKENGNQYKPCEIEGVQLTPGILQKAGFKEVLNTIYPSNKVFENRLIQLKQMGNEFITVYINDRCTTEYATVYKYMHQLQNLHFALELSELQIEL